jgi:hypothetical protein
VEGGFASAVRQDLSLIRAGLTQFSRIFRAATSVPGSDTTHLIAEESSGRNSLAAPVQNGRTITKMTIPIINSVGTSFIMR